MRLKQKEQSQKRFLAKFANAESSPRNVRKRFVREVKAKQRWRFQPTFCF